MKDKNNLPRLMQETYGELLRSIDDFFQGAFKGFEAGGLFSQSIPVDAYEEGSNYVIQAELPGVDKEQVELDIFQNHARIRVRHEEIIDTKNNQNETIKYQHSVSNRERVVPLPYQVKEQDVKATFKNGLLTIRIPNHRKIIDIE